MRAVFAAAKPMVKIRQELREPGFEYWDYTKAVTSLGNVNSPNHQVTAWQSRRVQLLALFSGGERVRHGVLISLGIS